MNIPPNININEPHFPKNIYPWHFWNLGGVYEHQGKNFCKTSIHFMSRWSGPVKSTQPRHEMRAHKIRKLLCYATMGEKKDKRTTLLMHIASGVARVVFLSSFVAILFCSRPKGNSLLVCFDLCLDSVLLTGLSLLVMKF